MGTPLSKLSLGEIRARYANGHEAVSPRLLSQLRRDPRRGARRLYEVLSRRFERERDERLRLDAMLNFERVLWKSGVRHVAGVDEAGMGPLAGPVVAAAVVFPADTELAGVDDSKRLDAEQRAGMAEAIRKHATGIGIGVAEVDEIDRLNIHHAGLLAMRRAVESLPFAPGHVLVDARTIPGLDMPQNTFNKGDGIDYSIAAASIIAKTYRDRLMEELDARHPGYGFARHKGYGTAQHRAALRELGPSPVHRRSFPVIREVLGEHSRIFYALREAVFACSSGERLARVEEGLAREHDDLAEHEHRKLRILIGRRWKALRG